MLFPSILKSIPPTACSRWEVRDVTVKLLHLGPCCFLRNRGRKHSDQNRKSNITVSLSRMGLNHFLFHFSVPSKQHMPNTTCHVLHFLCLVCLCELSLFFLQCCSCFSELNTTQIRKFIIIYFCSLLLTYSTLHV